MKCEDCKYWYSEGNKVGQCRRKAPVNIGIIEPSKFDPPFEGTVIKNWASTVWNDWCGEFYARENENLNKHIQEMDISARARNALEGKNICYIKDLVQKNSKELKKLHGFGKICLSEVEYELNKLGLNLKSNDKCQT